MARWLHEDQAALLANLVKAPDVFVALGYDFRVLFVNAVAERYYKRKREELVGEDIDVVFPAMKDTPTYRTIRKHVANRMALESRYQSPLNHSWVQLTGRPFEKYYAFTLKPIDHKELLRSELRQQMRRKGRH